MKFLIEIEGPESVQPSPGEPELLAEVQIFILRWLQQSSRFRMVAKPAVTVQRLDFDTVPVKAEQLMRLQKKASTLEDSERFELMQLLTDIVAGDPGSVEDDRKMCVAIDRARELLGFGQAVTKRGPGRPRKEPL